MIHKTTRRRVAALTSGAVAALGLVVVPAVAGLSTASATVSATSIPYACVYSGFQLPGKLTLSVATPDSAAVGDAVNPAMTGTFAWDDAALSMLRIANLQAVPDTLKFTMDTTTGAAAGTAVLNIPSAPLPASGPVAWDGNGSWGAIDTSTPGAVALSIGNATLAGKATTSFSGPNPVDISIPCTAATTKLGEFNVTDGGVDPEPEGLSYTCVLTGGPAPVDLPSTVNLEVTPPASATAGQPFEADVDVTIDMGNLALGPVGGFTGELDLDFLVGDQASVGTLPIDPVTLVPNEKNDVVLHAAGPVQLLAPATAGPADIDIADIVRNLQANVYGSNIPNTGDCTPDAGQDLTVGSIDVEQAEPVAVPVDGAVKITGTAKVGKTVKAVAGKTDGATVKYQWLSGGKAIKGATKPSLKLTKALKGKKVSVKATYSKDGFLPVTQTSKAVTVKK
ncbi:hypothetical protein [Nocardioides sp. SR21]|uniref:hypothetical protein n=1 Tax=Nocardioides sp. SR21 TaxID=2919501 RepID=UPI001FAAA202|nr:hypothetical protein [Nocardioides sp. SR21]